MKLSLTPRPLIVALFLLMLWTPVLAQEAQDVSDMTLSEEAFRQEIVAYVTTPCIERAVDESPTSKYFSGKDFIRLMETETMEPFGTLRWKNDAFIASVIDMKNIGMVKEKPEQARKIWYKMMQKACLEGMKESFNRGVKKKSETSPSSVAQSEPAPAIAQPSRTEISSGTG